MRVLLTDTLDYWQLLPKVLTSEKRVNRSVSGPGPQCTWFHSMHWLLSSPGPQCTWFHSMHWFLSDPGPQCAKRSSTVEGTKWDWRCGSGSSPTQNPPAPPGSCLPASTSQSCSHWCCDGSEWTGGKEQQNCGINTVFVKVFGFTVVQIKTF